MRIYSVKKDPSMKIQRLNIEGLASFEKNKNKRERKKENIREVIAYSQQAWRRYNHVKS
jgi:hypothetical protein